MIFISASPLKLVYVCDVFVLFTFSSRLNEKLYFKIIEGLFL